MKTVFILGAGFSYEAGAPTQLMEKTFECHRRDESSFLENKFSLFKIFLTDRLHVRKNQLEQVELGL